LRTLDEHTKLARVAVSFDPRLDEAFRINVAKMRVQLPQQLREQFEKAIGPVIKIAQKTYRKSDGGGSVDPSSRSGLTADLNPPPSRANSSEAGNKNKRLDGSPSASPPTGRGTGNGRLWTVEELRKAAERVATTQERPIVRKIFDRLASDLRHE
jgi:hypothetical protein